MPSRPVNSAGLIATKLKILLVVFILLSNLKGRNAADDGINYRKGPFEIQYCILTEILSQVLSTGTELCFAPTC
jgi:hypothetical protein